MLQTSEAIFSHLRTLIERTGEVRGKVGFAYAGADLFMTHHLVTDEPELQFLAALNAVYRWEEISQFFLCFAGHIGEKAPGSSLLLISGNGHSAPQISQWMIEKDAAGKFAGFSDTDVQDWVGSMENPLNLLREPLCSVQHALAVIEKCKRSPAKYILKGF